MPRAGALDLGFLPKGLRKRTTTALDERVATARDLWQRRLIEVQHGPAVAAERLPAAVISPENTEEVAELVALARREGVSLVPFGAGSGVCGGIECDPRTLVVDTKRMRSVKRSGSRLSVGPGALGVTLEERIEREGMTIGHFPSSILCSTVGGWVAARGAGQCSGRYGKIEDMVVSAECVLGTGEVLRFHRRSEGLNLLPLLIGSEGALAVFTALELRLHPVAEEREFCAFELPTLEAGVRALRHVVQAGLRPAVARLYDPLDSLLLGDSTRRGDGVLRPGAQENPLLARALLAPRLLNLAVEAAERTFLGRSKLLFVLEGRAGEAREDAERLAKLVEGAGGLSLGPDLAVRWYEHRYRVSYKQSNVFRSGAWSDTLEVAAPWSRLLDVFTDVRRALGRHALVLAHMSHAYPDGCSIYFTFLGRSRSLSAEREHRAAWRDALAAALGAGAAISHHHGIGRVRAAALSAELGPGGRRAQRGLKQAWDPSRVMNPGCALSLAGSVDDWSPAPAPRRSPAIRLDAESGLVEIAGTSLLTDVEQAIRASGFTLGLSSLPSMTAGEWISVGLPGLPSPWLDPVEQRVAGLEGILRSGPRLSLSPAPRRATGPDLTALFVGAQGRLGKVESAWLRVHPLNAHGARPLAHDGESAPAVTAAEHAAFDALDRALS